MIDFKEKTVVVLGAARQGLALAKYAARHGAGKIIITDKRSIEQLKDARESMAEIDPEWVCGEHPLSHRAEPTGHGRRLQLHDPGTGALAAAYKPLPRPL